MNEAQPDPSGGGVGVVEKYVGSCAVPADRAHAQDLGAHIPFGDLQKNQSLTFAVGYVLFFLLIMWAMYRMKIFIKV